MKIHAAWLVACFTTSLLCAIPSFAQTAGPSVRLAHGAEVIDGESPAITLTHLRAGQKVTIHAFRLAVQYAPRTHHETNVLADASATFQADAEGSVSVDEAAPLYGTYTGADPLGLLWSGKPIPLQGNEDEAISQGVHLSDHNAILLRVSTGSTTPGAWGEARFHLTDGANLVTVRPVAVGAVNGAFAEPKDRQGALPAIILLHGSEGGSVASARETAIRFAQLGYAAFALNYFAWPPEHIDGVPQALVDIPVEDLAQVRAWLRQQPGVDAEAVALWGASKGAEFALLGASQYPWVSRVVACVPSSVVWSGFGRPPAADEVYSSWSVNGKGVPYIPYDDYSDALEGRYSPAFVHSRSLNKASAEQRAAARIPLERTHAKILLLAATNDVVWPSARMATELSQSMARAGKAAQLDTRIFDNASHYICGTGSEMRRIYPVHKPEGDDPTPEADAAASATGWRATKAFLRP